MRTMLVIVVFAIALGAHGVRAQQTINCSEDKVSMIAATQVSAGLMLLTTGSYLGNLRGGGDSARFDYWYGTHADEQVDFIENLAEKVYNVMDDATFNCDCGDQDETRYGFVRPGDPPYHLRLCTPFFEATDFVEENVTTFVHELSHFFGTRDCMDPNILVPCDPNAPVPDTAQAAHDFAVRDPSTASWNAYNWERFVIDRGRQ